MQPKNSNQKKKNQRNRKGNRSDKNNSMLMLTKKKSNFSGMTNGSNTDNSTKSQTKIIENTATKFDDFTMEDINSSKNKINFTNTTFTNTNESVNNQENLDYLQERGLLDDDKGVSPN